MNTQVLIMTKTGFDHLRALLSRYRVSFKATNPMAADATVPTGHSALGTGLSISVRHVIPVLGFVVLAGVSAVCGYFAFSIGALNTTYATSLNRAQLAGASLNAQLSAGTKGAPVSLNEARQTLINEAAWLSTFAANAPEAVKLAASKAPASVEADLIHAGIVTIPDTSPLVAAIWSVVEGSAAVTRNDPAIAWFSRAVVSIGEDEATLLQLADALPKSDAEAMRSAVTRLSRGILLASRATAGRDAQSPAQDDLAVLNGLAGRYPTLGSAVKTFEGNILSVKEGEAGAARFAETTKKLMGALEVARAAGTGDHDRLALQLAIGSLVAAFLVLVFGAVANVRHATRLARMQEGDRLSADQHNGSTQQAIVTLLKEISAVAGGDLTVRTNATHNELTGVIADALNATTSKLAGVVNVIKASAETVDLATKDAVQGVADVSIAAQMQRDEVDVAASKVLDVMSTIVQVTSVTKEAARVAGNSIRSAAQGRDAVTNAITSMGIIRDQMEEASARLRRMGEASNEITLITETVADISEHTGVLALNANVQAAEAGEAGRGFAAVAAEVQRLALRSDQSLKKISALVDSLQTDARGAIATMEKTVAEVVTGVKIVTKAGDDLAIIEMVAGELADLVEQVNTAMSEQGTSADEISERIRQVTALAAITAETLAASAEKIRQVTLVTDQLGKSVAEFHV